MCLMDGRSTVPIRPSERVIERLRDTGLVLDEPLVRSIRGLLDSLGSERSVATYGSDLATYLRFCAQIEVDPLKVRRDEIQAYVAFLRQSRGAAGKTHRFARDTIARQLAVVRGLYREMIERDLYDHANPALRLSRIDTAPAPGPAALDDSQIDALLDHMRRLEGAARTPVRRLRAHRDRLIIELFLWLAPRVGELAPLRWAALKVEDPYVFLDVIGKGTHFGRLKVTPDLYRSIGAYREALDEAGIPTSEADAILPAIGHGYPPPKGRPTPRGPVPPMTTRAVFDVVDAALGAVGAVGHRTGPHLLRRTSVTKVWEESGDLVLAQRHARHRQPTTTEAHYIKPSDAYARTGVDVLKIGRPRPSPASDREDDRRS